MSRDKQIEEMAKVICGGCPNGQECMRCLCADWYKAEKLYDAGYRKQRKNTVNVVKCKGCRHSALTSIDGVIYCFKKYETVKCEDYCSCGEPKLKGGK